MGNKLKYNPISGNFDFVGGGGLDIVYPNSFYQSFFQAQHLGVGTAPQANKLNAYPIIVESKYIIDAVRSYVLTPAAGAYVFGIYKQDKTTGLPGDLVFQTAAFDKGVGGYQIQTGFNITLSPDIYFVAINADSSTGALGGAFAEGVLKNIISDYNPPQTGTIIQINYVYTGTLPATFGSPVTAPYSTNKFIYCDFKQ